MVDKEILDKWETIGFLEGLNDGEKIKLALGYEILANTLITDSFKSSRIYDVRCEEYSFPTLRKLLINYPEYEFTVDFIKQFLHKLTIHIRIVIVDFIENTTPKYLTMEMQAESLNNFINSQYGIR
mgnify:CR=1 FL=1